MWQVKRFPAAGELIPSPWLMKDTDTEIAHGRVGQRRAGLGRAPCGWGLQIINVTAVRTKNKRVREREREKSKARQDGSTKQQTLKGPVTG